MDFLQAGILSLVEGFSEFLPISSTGHLILASKLLNIPQTEFVKSFEIIIQLGAILAVVFLYWKKVFTKFNLWPNLLIAFLPTALVGLTLYKLIKDTFLGNSNVTLLALFLGGIFLILFEIFYKEKGGQISEIEKISRKQAFLIGVFQSISIVPGISRAAATILGGMFLGLKRVPATEFSFLLAMPTMFAATGLDLVKSEFKFSANEMTILAIGFIGSFITAILAVKFLLKFLQTHTFIPFGIYRIILAVLFWMFV